MPKTVKLTDFEINVTVSLLENALNGWEGNQARQNAAQRVIDKLSGSAGPRPVRERE